jgi:hypothetical protein
VLLARVKEQVVAGKIEIGITSNRKKASSNEPPLIAAQNPIPPVPRWEALSSVSRRLPAAFFVPDRRQ